MGAPEGEAKGDGDAPSLREWLDGIRERDLPVLGGTMRELCNAADDGGSSASDLAGVVLRDVSLTSDIIRTANSVYFNPGGQRIATVSRAVVLLGFDTVRSIGLSLALLDSLVRGHARERVHRVFAASVEAALCARAVAEQRRDPNAEELFIAALLGRVGELAFWCLGDGARADALERALAAAPAGGERECERRCLGFSLRDLTRALVREWRLGELTEDGLRPGGPTGTRATVAAGAHEVVRHLHADDDSAARRRLGELRLDDDAAARVIARVRDEAPAIARALGVEMPGARAGAEDAVPATPREPDPGLQMRVLREMAVSVREGGDLQALFDLLMEGLYRGLALDGAAVATLRRGGKGLRLRASLGDAGALGAALADPDDSAAAATALLRDTVGSLSAAERAHLPAGLGAALRPHVLVGPLRVHGRSLGVVLGDADGPSDSDRLDVFDHFVEQAQLCIAHLVLAGG